MIRRFCDLCGAEMDSRNTPNLGGPGNVRVPEVLR